MERSFPSPDHNLWQADCADNMLSDQGFSESHTQQPGLQDDSRGFKPHMAGDMAANQERFHYTRHLHQGRSQSDSDCMTQRTLHEAKNAAPTRLYSDSIFEQMKTQEMNQLSHKGSLSHSTINEGLHQHQASQHSGGGNSGSVWSSRQLDDLAIHRSMNVGPKILHPTASQSVGQFHAHSPQTGESYHSNNNNMDDKLFQPIKSHSDPSFSLEHEGNGQQQAYRLRAANPSFMQPIKVMTQALHHHHHPHPHHQGHHLSHHQGAAPPTAGTASSFASNQTWSNPSTPNSMSEAGTCSSLDSQGVSLQNAATGGRYPFMFQQKAQQRFSPHSPSSRGNQSPIPPFLDRRGFGQFRGRTVASLPPRHRHSSEESRYSSPPDDRGSLAQEKFTSYSAPHASMSAPEHHLAQDGSSNAFFPKEFPYQRNPFFEELLASDAVSNQAFGPAPPPPFLRPDGKFPATFQNKMRGSPHAGFTSAEGMEYYPFDPYFQGRMTPTFFGPNEMFFPDIPPHHFYGLPPYFPGFKQFR